MKLQLQCVECSNWIDADEFAWGHDCELIDNY